MLDEMVDEGGHLAALAALCDWAGGLVTEGARQVGTDYASDDDDGGEARQKVAVGREAWTLSLEGLGGCVLQTVFPEGFDAAGRDEALDHAFADPALRRALRAALAAGLSAEDHARCVTAPADRDCGYYMLAEDEELGVGDDGSPDGDPCVRGRAAEWRVTAVRHPTAAAVVLEGFYEGGDPALSALALVHGAGEYCAVLPASCSPLARRLVDLF